VMLVTATWTFSTFYCGKRIPYFCKIFVADEFESENDMAFRHEPILDACIVSMETLQYAIVPYSRQVHTSQLLVYLI
jgi:hypothetical protein